jgi:geranylgeranylglycerol-phosphate geranylgeranyltransferase
MSAAGLPQPSGLRLAVARLAVARGRALALMQLTRIEKPLGASLYALLGAYLGVGPDALVSARTYTAAAVVALVTAFGFVINDCCDVAVDALGKPQRPIPSGRISRLAAAAFAWTLAAAALLVSATLGPSAALFAAAAVAVSAAYSLRLKSTLLLGNAAVALLVAAVLAFGAMVAGGITVAVGLAAAITFPYIVGQEALFNLEDEDEDRAAGLRTTATQLGTERTRALVCNLLLTFMATALAPWILGQASAVYLFALLVFVLGPTGVLLYLLRRPLSPRAVSRAVRLSRLLWATSFVPLTLLG